MASQNVTIKCGRCKVPVEGPANPKDNDRFACPRCGNGDTYKNIMAEAGDSASDQVAGKLDQMLAGVARGSKILNYKASPRPQKQRRFIIDLKL